MGISKKDLDITTHEILVEDTYHPEEAIISTGIENLDIMPASVQLAGAEVELIELAGREKRLKRAIDILKPKYDYIFIDCPPSLGILTINSLTAVDSVLIPIQCEFYALEGVSQLMSTIDIVRRSMNPDLKIEDVHTEHVRWKDEPLDTGSGRSQEVLQRKGIYYCYPEECQTGGSAELRHACNTV